MVGEDTFIEMKKLGKKNPQWHWIYTFMLLGLFVGIFSIAYVGGETVISRFELSRLIVLCCVVGLLIPLKVYGRWMGITRAEAFLFNVLGVGPLLSAILLWLNFSIPLRIFTATHLIINKQQQIDIGGLGGSSIMFTLENNALEDYQEFRRMELTQENSSILKGTHLQLQIQEGVLGYQTIKGAEVITR